MHGMGRSSVCVRAILEGGTGKGVEGWAGGTHKRWILPQLLPQTHAFALESNLLTCMHVAYIRT